MLGSNLLNDAFSYSKAVPKNSQQANAPFVSISRLSSLSSENHDRLHSLNFQTAYISGFGSRFLRSILSMQ
jgi:hypothetical protein